MKVSGAGGFNVSFSWEGADFPSNIRQGGDVFLSVLSAEMATVARAMESFAKANHPWQNQTGAAESSFTVRMAGKYEIVAQHGVFYGIYLEYKHGGRWGIIPKTLDFGLGQIRDVGVKAWAAAWRFG